MPKKKWTTPQLVVLVRGKMGDGNFLLVDCKSSQVLGANDQFEGCLSFLSEDAKCGLNCDVQIVS